MENLILVCYFLGLAQFKPINDESRTDLEENKTGEASKYKILEILASLNLSICPHFLLWLIVNL